MSHNIGWWTVPEASIRAAIPVDRLRRAMKRPAVAELFVSRGGPYRVIADADLRRLKELVGERGKKLAC